MAIKAFMSDRAQRQEGIVDWVKGTRHRRGTAITRFTSIELGHAAFLEARAILEETEPNPGSTATATINAVLLARAAHGELGGFYCLQAAPIAAALADALRAFVGEE